MKKFLWILTIAFLAVGLMVSQASAFFLDYNGPIIMNFSSYDMGSFYDAAGNKIQATGAYYVGDTQVLEDSWGILRINTIYAADEYGPNSGPVGSPLWYDGKDGEQITGIFYGITDAIVDLTNYPNTQIWGVGGLVDFYLDSGTIWDPTLGSGGRTAVNQYTTVTDGATFFSGMFAPGALMGDLDSTNDYITFANAFNFAQNKGVGSFFVNIIATEGDYSLIFNSNAMLVNNDLYAAGYNPGFDDAGNPVPNVDFIAQFNSNPTRVSDWLVTDFDPARGGAVPEPSTLILLGMGLLGIGVARRFRS